MNEQQHAAFLIDYLKIACKSSAEAATVLILALWALHKTQAEDKSTQDLIAMCTRSFNDLDDSVRRSLQ